MNERFGRLLVVYGPIKVKSALKWLCKCDCGKESYVTWFKLKTGHTTSCGCYHKEWVSARFSKDHEINTPEYHSWYGMKTRCNNPKAEGFHNYGGRGIKVCERWKDFENFLADMGLKPGKNYSIERDDNNGNYEPTNCRWATRVEQSSNTRRNRLLVYEDQTKTLKEWSKTLSMTESKLKHKLTKTSFEEIMRTQNL